MATSRLLQLVVLACLCLGLVAAKESTGSGLAFGRRQLMQSISTYSVDQCDGLVDTGGEGVTTTLTCDPNSDLPDPGCCTVRTLFSARFH